MRPQIHSEKHYVQTSLSTIVGGAQLSIKLADGTQAVDAVADNVTVGNTIKAVFVEMWVLAQDTVPGSVLMSLYKAVGNDPLITTAEAAALHSWPGKKNCFYHTQGVIGDQDTNAVPFIRQWFKIPKGKQRFGLNDRLLLNIFAQGTVDLTICGFATYKEYS